MQQTLDNVNALNAVAAKQSREEGEHQNPNHFQEAGEPMTSIVDQTPDKGEFFDTVLTVEARFAGGTITVDVQHEDWIGEELVRVETPGTVLHLRKHEARDLAAALQNIATHLDESGVTC